VWCGVVWCGVVWCGVVWCGVVWCGTFAKAFNHRFKISTKKKSKTRRGSEKEIEGMMGERERVKSEIHFVR
jgi:hypothetical protein